MMSHEDNGKNVREEVQNNNEKSDVKKKSIVRCKQILFVLVY